MTTQPLRLRPMALLLACLLVGGCATASRDGGFSPAQKIARDTLGHDITWAKTEAEANALRTRVAALLDQPLEIERAVEVALLANPGLQADYWKLGIAEAELLAASRLPNPHLSLLRASHVEGGVREFKIEQALTFNLFSLITLPQQQAIAQRQFERAQREVAQDMLALAFETRKAWVDAVAAEELRAHFARVRDAADAAAELAQRMAAVGNVSALAHAREQAPQQEARVALARAELEVASARERLARLLGLADAARLRLPAHLPEVPRSLPPTPALEQRALDARLDLAMMRLDTEALARSLGLTRTTRLINVLEVGPVRVLEGPRDAPYKTGYEISFELPLFDWGSARVAGAEARYMRQVNLAAQAAIEAQSEIREAARTLQTHFDIARHYQDDVLPLKKRINDETVLRYNGMLIGPLDLLRETRANMNAVKDAIDARRDFWLAQADLDRALTGKARPSAARRAASPSASTAAAH